VPGTVTTTGVTLRTYVYERWSLSGTSLGWYPQPPNQVNWAYGVAGQEAPFTVTAGAPGYITVKATYPLNGSANYPATGWRWDRGDNGAPYTLWANGQNSQFIAYAGDYTIGWRLFARRTSDGVTDNGFATTTVCIQSKPCVNNPLLVAAPGVSASLASAVPASGTRGSTFGATRPVRTPRVVGGHFGAGPWLSRDGEQAAVQLYSLAGRHDDVREHGSWPNSFALADGLPARRSVSRNGSTLVVSEMRKKASPLVTNVQLVTSPLKEPGSYRVSYALDPDLGARADDDKLSWIDSVEAVVVSDPDSGSIAYGWSNLPEGSRTTVREYASASGLLQPETPNQAYLEQRADSRALGTAGDVRFALTLGAITVAQSGRLQVMLIAATGRTADEALINLLAERRRNPQPLQLADDAPSTSAPQSFALRQSLGRPGATFSTAGIEGGGAALSARAQLRQFGITTLEYAVPGGQAEEVRIRIYSSTGQLVRNLVREQKGAGEYVVQWDSLNERGERVAPGVYVALMEAGSFKATRKLVITR
ncbi:MAG TPA: FlgD immunoglobulin-like domain containing protein, partial [Gemmatimonadales bacterium]|nr:FlgD immunoglobulin-like domain containing protein [Gemmatimonadales bacterium]